MNIKHYFIILSIVAFFSMGSIASANIVIPDEVCTYDKASPAFFVDGINAEQAELKDLKGTVFQKDNKVNSGIQFKITKDRKNRYRILATANPLAPGTYIIKVKYKDGQEVQSDLKVFSTKPANKIYIPEIYYGGNLRINFSNYHNSIDLSSNYSITVQFDEEAENTITGLDIGPQHGIGLKDEYNNVSITLNWANQASGQKIELYKQSIPIAVPEPETGPALITDYEMTDNGNYLITIAASLSAPDITPSDSDDDYQLLKELIIMGWSKKEVIKKFEDSYGPGAGEYVNKYYDKLSVKLSTINKSRKFSVELSDNDKLFLITINPRSLYFEEYNEASIEVIDAQARALNRFEKDYVEVKLEIKAAINNMLPANIRIPLEIININLKNGKKSYDRPILLQVPVMLVIPK